MAAAALPLTAPAALRQAVLQRRIRLFVSATITYNVLEAVVAITAGRMASSVALVGFGLDSIIEVASAAAVAWQFAGRDPAAREKVALRVIASSFFALAAYVSVDAVISLVDGHQARPSSLGIVLAAASLLVMPLLSFGQRRTGLELNSRSAVADSKQTLLCTYLSAVLLVGLALNSLFGWTFADPIAALAIAVVAAREGRAAWNGDGCCAPNAVRHGEVDSCAPDTVTDESAAATGCGQGCCTPTPRTESLTLTRRPTDG